MMRAFIVDFVHVKSTNIRPYTESVIHLHDLRKLVILGTLGNEPVFARPRTGEVIHLSSLSSNRNTVSH
jgi:hypothetical protein